MAPILTLSVLATPSRGAKITIDGVTCAICCLLRRSAPDITTNIWQKSHRPFGSSGIASVYTDRHTASGERMNPGAMTALWSLLDHACAACDCSATS
jgi:hypothetical protein